MGVTLPTVLARLVKCILSGEFVDMGELSQDALRAEFRRATEGEEKPSKAKSFRPVTDRDAWVASFAQYAGVVSRSYPEKAVALWGHLATVMSCQSRATSGWWRSYDVSLRHSYSSMKDADFLLNQCLCLPKPWWSAQSRSSARHLQRPCPWLFRGRRRGGHKPALLGMTAGLVQRSHVVLPTAVPGVAGIIPGGFAYLP